MGYVHVRQRRPARVERSQYLRDGLERGFGTDHAHVARRVMMLDHEVSAAIQGRHTDAGLGADSEAIVPPGSREKVAN